MNLDVSVARLAGAVALLLTACGLASSCAPPPFDFEKDGPPQHCLNQIFDGQESDVDCGGECAACELGKACLDSGDCAAGSCIEAFCQDESCSDGSVGGEESDLDCGGSLCKPCEPGLLCNGASDCDSQVCSDGVCSTPSCNDLVFNGDESDADCGGSCPECLPGRVCRDGADCVGGLCSVDHHCAITCLEGRADCDLDPENGCEVNTKTSASDCGECGAVCNLPHANAGCSGSGCYVESCEEPFIDCDGDDSNGCEVNAGADAENCGACGKTCPATHGTPLCIDSACDIQCDEGFDDCNDNPIDGCERGIDADAENCGSCGHVCPDDDGAPWCQDGVCGFTPCPDGFGDCNINPADGCETDLRTNVDNCNSCGHFCSTEHGTPACDDRVCVIDSCDDDYDDCDDEYVGGCEASLTSPTDCGACGTPCSIANAIANATASCSTGSCKVLSCTNPYEDCDGNGTSCEINLSNNASNCGACAADGGDDCAADFAPLNTTGLCVDQVCQPDQCFANFEDCDTINTNGCEADLKNDTATCGACDTSCETNHASATTCMNGACKPTCDDGWDDCSTPEQGCLTSIDTPAHCGSCMTSCSGGTPFCTNRACAARLAISLGNVTLNSAPAVCNSSPCNSFGLSVQHTILKPSGSYRVVVVTVATTATSQGTATPDSVSYGSTTVATPVLGDWTSNRAWAGVYVFKDAQLPAAALTASTVTVNIGTADSSTRVAASVLEFDGVEQATPVVDSDAVHKSICPPTSLTITTAFANSAVVSVASLFGQTTGVPTGTPTPTESLDVSASEFTGLAAYALTPAGDYTFGWTATGCNNNAHVAIALDPAKTP